MIINPGYEAPEARAHASRATCEAGVCLGKSRFGYGSALGEGISRDPLDNAEMSQGPNLYYYVRNSPLTFTDRNGTDVDDEAIAPNPENMKVIQQALDDAGGGATSASDDAAALANKLNHVFTDEHNLGDLVNKFGGCKEKAWQAIQDATQKSMSGAQNGVFKSVVNVAGEDITVTGNVQNGTVMTGNAWVPK